MNSWQRLAAATSGIVTLGNAVTLLGLLIALVGMYKIYMGELYLGVLLVGIGRSADIVDGYAASLTKTKSKVGEVLDAGSDKIVALVAFVVFFERNIVPFIPLLIIFLHNVVNGILSVFAKRTGKELHPSLTGKYAAFSEWMMCLPFVIAKLVARHSMLINHISMVIGYLLLIVTVGLATYSTRGYFKRVFRTANKKNGSS